LHEIRRHQPQERSRGAVGPALHIIYAEFDLESIVLRFLLWDKNGDLIQEST